MRRSFSQYYKFEVVGISLQPHMRATTTGWLLGLSPALISRWRRQVESRGADAFDRGIDRDEPDLSDLKEELRAAEDALDYLRRETRESCLYSIISALTYRETSHRARLRIFDTLGCLLKA